MLKTTYQFRKKMKKDGPIGRGIEMGTGLDKMRSKMLAIMMEVLGGRNRSMGSRNLKILGLLQAIKEN